MKQILYVPLVMIVLGSFAFGQMPVSVPVGIELGFGGGISLPSGDLSNFDNTGWHGLGKVRFHGGMPINIVGMGMYNRLPNKLGGESDYDWIFAAGLEYPLSAVAVSPYLGAEFMLVTTNNTGPGYTSITRGGLGLGGGVEFGLPGVGSLDASLKYHMLNLMGKDTNEITANQISISLALMFGMM